MKTDRASMAHSLEARVPFLDSVVTNFAFALPAKHKVRGLSKKVLLRKAAEPLVPREIVHGRKRGFSIPAAAWLRGELEPFARATLSPATLRSPGLLRAGARRRGCSTSMSRVRRTGAASCGGCLPSRSGTSGTWSRNRRRSDPREWTLWSREGLDRHDGECARARLPPLIGIMEGRGDEVQITARDYAQTLQLLELHGLEAEVIGRHGGRSRVQKARQMTHRLGALRRFAKGRGFDIALAHGSHELTITARRLGIPSTTTFDYEFATLQHQLGCRAATKVVVPDAIPPVRLGSTA